MAGIHVSRKNHTMRTLLFCCLAMLAFPVLAEMELPRRAAPGFTVEGVPQGLRVTRVETGSAAEEAGLAAGHIIVAINGKQAPGNHVGRDLLRTLEGGREVQLQVQRADSGADLLRFTPPPQPFETFENVTAEYGSLRTPDGALLRTIVTRPKDASGPLPAIFFTQWVSCDSVETNRPGVWLDVMREVIEQSGMVFVRVERSSGGDSRGPACHELDYETEVTHYRHAFDQLMRPPIVDTNQVYIWGNSLGATTAPLVAKGKRVAGIIVDGAGAQTYFERMLQFDRIGFEFSGADPATIDDRMRRHAEFHVEYLLNGRDPAQIVRERPHLAGVWSDMRGTGEGVHYGRPYAYHRQAARQDFLAAWSDFRGDALVLYHEFDQFEYLEGHAAIVDVLNRNRPGSAELHVLPSMGHDFRVYPSRDHAVQGRDGAPAPALATEVMLDWFAAEPGGNNRN